MKSLLDYFALVLEESKSSFETRISVIEFPSWAAQPGISTIMLQGKFFDTWGSSSSRQEALAKAFLEHIEREYYLENREALSLKTTSGIALHQSYPDAKNASKLELIERHTLIKASAERIPPRYSNLSGPIYQFSWLGPLGVWVSLSVVVENQGFFFASGADYTIEKSQEKANLELNGSGAYFSSPKKIQAKSADVELDKIRKYFLEKNLPDFMFLTEVGCVGPELTEDQISYASLHPPSWLHSLKDICFVVKAKSELLQELSLKEWNSTEINSIAIDLEKFNPDFRYPIVL